MRVLAAMSGGVDSAVAAARAVDEGHDVTGVHLALSQAPATLRTGSRGCCTLEDSRDARRAADVLGIPFYVWDLAEPFREAVVADFLAEYAAGRTPNPCLRCNERIKFAAVLDRARVLGFDAVVTGHYARLSRASNGAPVLRRAQDESKDQSYVLATLTPEQLSGARFPLGDSRKSEVRAEAAERGLAVAAKPDSHDICFIPDGDTAGFLRRHLAAAPGPVVDDSTGEVVGEHEGTHTFTVGQRKGLGVGRTPDGRPRYVLGIEPVSRTVRVGPREALAVSEIRLVDVVRHGGPAREVSGRALFGRAQFRAHGEPLPAHAEALPARAGPPPADGESARGPVPGGSGAEDSSSGDGSPRYAASGDTAARDEASEQVRIVLEVPAHGVAPGQTLVFYDTDEPARVLLAGRIVAAAASAGPAGWRSAGRTAHPA